jgi:hypothetical protein
MAAITDERLKFDERQFYREYDDAEKAVDELCEYANDLGRMESASKFQVARILWDHIAGLQRVSEPEEIARLNREVDSLNDCILRQQREINRLKGTRPAGKVSA